MGTRRARDCGDLLQFDEIRRRLHFGMPQVEGESTIALVANMQALGADDRSLVQRIVERAHRRRVPQLLPLRD